MLRPGFVSIFNVSKIARRATWNPRNAISTRTRMATMGPRSTHDSNTIQNKTASDDEYLRQKGYKRGDRVLLFDGVCVMCNAGVDFAIRNDPQKKLKLAALQSDVGKVLLRKFDAPTDLSTVVLLEGDTAYIKSDAVLRAGRHLGWYLGMPAQLALVTIPKALRDHVYSEWVAKNRYDWFGKKDECRLVDPKHRSRFLI